MNKLLEVKIPPSPFTMFLKEREKLNNEKPFAKDEMIDVYIKSLEHKNKLLDHCNKLALYSFQLRSRLYKIENANKKGSAGVIRKLKREIRKVNDMFRKEYIIERQLFINQNTIYGILPESTATRFMCKNGLDFDGDFVKEDDLLNEWAKMNGLIIEMTKKIYEYKIPLQEGTVVEE